jgi:two-component system OmpR family sensor kinase
MNSIRRYLLRALILALVAGSVLTTVLVYASAHHEINELYDRNMQEVAILLQKEMTKNPSRQVSLARSRVTRLKGEEEMLIQIWSPDGRLLYSSYPAIALPLQSKTGRFTTEMDQQSWHVYRTVAHDSIIQLAQPYDARRVFVSEMALNLLYPMLAQIPLIGLFIWLAVGRSLAPLDHISRAIHRRSASSLAPVEDTHIPEEIQPLVQELNGLLARLGTALAAQQRFTSDAAHELRTPLAAIKLQLSNLERAKDATEQQGALDKLHRGVDRAGHVVQQLLTFARLEPASAPGQARIDLAELARLSVEAHAEIAHARQIDLGLVRHEPAMVIGDAGQLRILIDNLVDNAIRYTPADGKVDVAAYPGPSGATLEVKDNGIGIAPEEHARIFERFYRVIGTQTDGTGLGLAIVRHIVDEHRGQIVVTDGIDGSGAGFILTLPLAVA